MTRRNAFKKCLKLHPRKPRSSKRRHKQFASQQTSRASADCAFWHYAHWRNPFVRLSRMTVLDWLLDSDPAIRWQVLRDLVHAPAEVVTAERVWIEIMEGD
jgi:hypothetical protein